jgi:hypothetical protein
MAEIVQADTATLLDIVGRDELHLYRIAVWPGIPGCPDVLASDADVVAGTDATVWWQRLTAVKVADGALVIETPTATYRPMPGDRNFVITAAGR